MILASLALAAAPHGHAGLPLWLNDVTCAGDVRVTVSYGAETRSEMPQLHCGE